MKRIIHIAFFLSTVYCLSSCQKDEFVSELDSEISAPQAKIIGNGNDDSNGGVSIYTDSVEITEPLIKTVREVSDGDDEADSGDDSKSKN